MLTETTEVVMSRTVAITAQIAPGKREQLASILAEGPPFDVGACGFRRHMAFLGDHQLVLLFEGDDPAADVRQLAASLPLAEIGRIGALVSAPELLSDSYEWSAVPA